LPHSQIRDNLGSSGARKWGLQLHSSISEPRGYSLIRYLSLCAALCGLPVCASAHKLEVGFFEAQPHVLVDTAGLPAGPAVELFNAVVQKMGLQRSNFHHLPLLRLLNELESGQIDVALFISKTPEREAKFVYPAKPYILTHPGLAVRNTSSLAQINSSDDFKTLSVIIMQGGVMSPAMRQHQKMVEIRGDTLFRRALVMVTVSRADAVFSPDIKVLESEAVLAGLEKQIRTVRLPDPPNGIYYLFSNKVRALYAEKYAAALEAVLKERGAYEGGFLK
jgi:ABC-type amino acid transport substrate-binding protein